jgi:hypothetical protein
MKQSRTLTFCKNSCKNKFELKAEWIFTLIFYRFSAADTWNDAKIENKKCDGNSEKHEKFMNIFVSKNNIFMMHWKWLKHCNLMMCKINSVNNCVSVRMIDKIDIKITRTFEFFARFVTVRNSN